MGAQEGLKEGVPLRLHPLHRVAYVPRVLGQLCLPVLSVLDRGYLGRRQLLASVMFVAWPQVVRLLGQYFFHGAIAAKRFIALDFLVLVPFWWPLGCSTAFTALVLFYLHVNTMLTGLPLRLEGLRS